METVHETVLSKRLAKRRERRWEEGDGGFQEILVCVCVLIAEGNFS